MTRFNTLFILLLLMPFLAFSQATTTWTGATSVDWFDASNWTNGLPGAGKDAVIPAFIASGNKPEIHQPLHANFKIFNTNQILVDAPFVAFNDFKNLPGGLIRNRNEFKVKGKFDNNAIFQNGCPTCNPQNIGLTIDEGGEFTNRATIINNAKFILGECSVTYFDSPTKAYLDGDIRLKGVAYLLQGDVAFSENTGTLLFNRNDKPQPSLAVKNAVVQLGADGTAILEPSLVDDGTTAEYCSTPVNLSLSRLQFDCSHVGTNIVTVTATDGMGNTATAQVQVEVLPSVACYCTSFTNGGEIGGQQFFCPGSEPAPLISITQAVSPNPNYAFQYHWERTFTDPNTGTVQTEIIPNANSSEYVISAQTQTAWYRRVANLVGCTERTAVSNWVQVVSQSPFPIARCIPNVILALQTGLGSVTLSLPQIDDGSEAGCIGIGSYTLSQSTFTQPGFYNVTMLVASLNGDVSACQSVVEVRNPPTVSQMITNCPPDIQVTAPSYTSTHAIVNFNPPTVTTTCPLNSTTPPTVTLIEGCDPGSPFPVGESRIVYQITDNCGNTRTCPFTIRVVRPPAPTWCAESVNSIISVWLERVTVNAQGRYVYQYKVRNNHSKGMSHVAFEIPCAGVKAVNMPSNFPGTTGKYYTVENTTNNPFRSIKFNTIGEGILCGQIESFSYTLPANCPPPNKIKVSAKVANNVYTITLNLQECVNNGSQPLVAPSFSLKSSARRSGFGVVVDWQSKVGKSVISYRVQRSADGNNWENIHKISGGAQDGETSYFTWTDNNPLPGKSYYRIQAHLNINMDWETEASPIEMPAFGTFTVFPNPAQDYTWLDLQGFEGKTVHVLMFNNLSKVVYQTEIKQAAAQPYELPLSGLQSGYYSIQIICEGLKIERKLIVATE